MPIYAYTCKNDHQFERMLKFSEIDRRVRCPECKTAGKRLLVQVFADSNSTRDKSHNDRVTKIKRFTNW